MYYEFIKSRYKKVFVRIFDMNVISLLHNSTKVLCVIMILLK